MTLTLEQVKQAGRFAFYSDYSDDAFIYVPGEGFIHGEFWGGPGGVVRDDDPPEAWSEGEEFGGWHHLPGCDCEFCEVAVS